MYDGENSSVPTSQRPRSLRQVMLRWNERPNRALVLLKPEQELLPLAAQTIDYLQSEMGLNVMVEAAAADELKKVRSAGSFICCIFCGCY